MTRIPLKIIENTKIDSSNLNLRKVCKSTKMVQGSVKSSSAFKSILAAKHSKKSNGVTKKKGGKNRDIWLITSLHL
jgi:hypothetical protein